MLNDHSRGYHKNLLFKTTLCGPVPYVPSPQLRLVGVRTSHIYFFPNISWTPSSGPRYKSLFAPTPWLYPVTASHSHNWISIIIGELHNKIKHLCSLTHCTTTKQPYWILKHENANKKILTWEIQDGRGVSESYTNLLPGQIWNYS